MATRHICRCRDCPAQRFVDQQTPFTEWTISQTRRVFPKRSDFGMTVVPQPDKAHDSHDSGERWQLYQAYTLSKTPEPQFLVIGEKAGTVPEAVRSLYHITKELPTGYKGFVPVTATGGSDASGAGKLCTGCGELRDKDETRLDFRGRSDNALKR